MMNFDEFKEMIVVEMEQRAGVGNVVIERITKNNAMQMNGLIIRENNRNMAPVINLDSFYKELWEKPFSLLVDEIWELYQSGKTKSDIDLSTFLKWESVRDKVVMKVINYEYNRELFKQVPHYKYLDLAVVYYLIIDREKDREATVMINNQHLEMWSISKNELQEAAYSNYGKFYLPYIRKLDYAERLKEIVREVNSTCLEQVELLSDNVYMYKRESGSIIIAEE